MYTVTISCDAGVSPSLHVYDAISIVKQQEGMFNVKMCRAGAMGVILDSQGQRQGDVHINSPQAAVFCNGNKILML